MTHTELGICVVDPRGVITQMSSGNSEMLGWGSNELVGAELFDLMPNYQVAMRRAVHSNVLQTGHPYSALSEFVGKSGASVYVDLTVTAGRDLNGGINSVIGLWQPLRSFKNYQDLPMLQSQTNVDTADYIASMLRELACLVGPSDDILREFLLSTLKVAIRADNEARQRAILKVVDAAAGSTTK